MRSKRISKTLTAFIMAMALMSGAGAVYASAAGEEPSDTPIVTDDPEDPKLTVGDVTELKFDKATKRLSWQAVENAQGYIVYSVNGDEYTELARTQECEYSPADISDGMRKSFAVKAYALNEDSEELTSENYTLAEAALAPLTVETLTVTKTTAAAANLKWSTVENCDGYRIYVYTLKNGVKTLKSTQYVKGGSKSTVSLTGLASGSCYCVYVKAYTESAEGKLFSPKYTGKRVYTKLPAVTGIKGVKSDNKSITLSWTKQSGVDGYKIYRYDKSLKKWIGVRTIVGNKNSYKISGLTSAYDYTVTVKSYKSVEGKSISNVSYKSFLYSTAPNNVSGFKMVTAGDTYTKLRWNAVPRATGYIVYQYNDKTGKWSRVRRTINTYMTIKDIDLKNGKQIKFAVRAFRKSSAVAELKSPTYPIITVSTLFKLEEKLKKMTSGYYGDWSIYVKNLNTDEYFSINNKPMYAASTIKLYAMAATYDRIEQGKFTESSVYKYLNAMITVSDNTSFNYLIQKVGLGYTHQWAQDHGYTDTTQYHALMYSTNYSTALNTGSGSNQTSAQDCGRLLESIYRGECVSKSASAKMLSLLKAQKVRNKIPSGIPSGVTVANKTGEVDDQSHDTAIVFSPNGDFIICIFCTAYNHGWSSAKYHGVLAKEVYSYFNS